MLNVLSKLNQVKKSNTNNDNNAVSSLRCTTQLNEFPLKDFLTDRNPLSDKIEIKHNRKQVQGGHFVKDSKRNRKVSSDYGQMRDGNNCRTGQEDSVQGLYVTRVQQIQEILKAENINLKNHRDFLLNQVNHYKAQLKQYKAKINMYQVQIQEITHQKDVYKIQSLQMKDFALECIQKMEQLITQNTNNSNQQQNQQYNQQQPQCNQQYNQQQPQYIQNHYNTQNHQNKQYQESPYLKNEYNVKHLNQLSKLRNSAPPQEVIINKSEQDNIEPMSAVQDLTDRFEALMYQYTTTKDKNTRRQCIELAKEIKKMKSQLSIQQSIVQQDSVLNGQNDKNNATLKFIKIPQANSTSSNINYPKSRITQNPNVHNTGYFDTSDIKARKTTGNLGKAYTESIQVDWHPNKEIIDQNFGKYIKNKINQKH